MKFALRKNAAAAMLVLAPLGAVMVAQPALADNFQYHVAPDQHPVAQTDQGVVRNMTLNSDSGLSPGATLRVEVHATPNARWANVNLGDDVRVPLRERAPGEYIGTHVIRRGERIDPDRLMTVHAGWGEGPVTLAFNYPPSFRSLAMGSAPATSNAQVNSFGMNPSDADFDPGSVVRFRLVGTPRAHAWVDIPDVARRLPLREVRPGVYVGSYTVRRGDDSDSFGHARAVLQNGDQRVVIGANDRDGDR